MREREREREQNVRDREQNEKARERRGRERKRLRGYCDTSKLSFPVPDGPHSLLFFAFLYHPNFRETKIEHIVKIFTFALKL